ncbi:4-carboxymuconolactone decarboxylase-like protein [Microthyrium microscopicum]|uniref:4-carboxymuconolactone decarboxylase-like protein n=1 Tax=Microthyrium microscopicum TaxID=703497 RepID=A0A6A6TVR3_9PEZI|nr:4-carboxymuconolactone decarboxylase-like protein [Microthyrium microscopicum]
MRLTYTPDPPPFSDPAELAIVDRIKTRRAPRDLTPLDRTLLISPPVADGWNSFLGAVRTRTNLSNSIREAAICRVAALNRAWFEWEHHAHLLRADEIASDTFLQAIFSAAPGTWKAGADDVPDAKHALVLEYTDAVTLTVEVPSELFARVKGEFEEREIAELTATIGAYNCVSRFLVALDVGERVGEEGMNKALEHVGGVPVGTKPAPRSYA